MKDRCPSCGSAYQIDDLKVPDKGAYARCPKCHARFFLTKEVKSREEGSHVQKQENHMIICPKCGYQRQPKDDEFTPPEECPKCGALYEKAGAHIEKGDSGIVIGKVIGHSGPLSSKVRKLLDENVTPDEKVLFCLVGNFKQAIIALPNRLLVMKPGFMAGATFGARVTSFLYKDITGIEVNTGLVNAVIEISTPSYQATKQKDWWSMDRDRDPAKVSNCLPVSKVHLKEFQPYLEKLRVMIADAKKDKTISQQKGAENIASQLEQLVKLHQSGSLTEEEFQNAKKRLLEIK